MKKSARITALLLFSSLVLTACGENGTSEETTAASPDSTETAAIDNTVDAKGFMLDSLPSDLNFGGKTVTVFGWNHYEPVEFEAKEVNGDVVNDAYYNRNRYVEERLNVKLEFIEELGRYSEDYLTQLNQSIMSGSGYYDIAACHSHRMASAAYNGYLMNLNDIEHLDLAKPWWVQSLSKETSIGDACYLATGDISVSYLTRLQGIAFNADFLDDFSLENPYDLVLSGDWTYDKMIAMTKGIYSDLNNNGAKDEGDRFGIGYEEIQMQAMIYPAGIKIIGRGDDGKLEISSTYTSDRMVDLIEKLCNLFHSSNDATVIAKEDDISIFAEGRSLFHGWPLCLLQAGQMRDAKFDYGFVPGPKLDQNQEDYYISSSNAFSIWGVPLDASDKAMSGAVMEALASQGYRTTTPALFEVAYKVKYNTDTSEKQTKIFDLIRSNVQYDFGKIFANVVGSNVLSYAGRIFQNVNTGWISNVESFRSSVEEKLVAVEAAFSENAKG